MSQKLFTEHLNNYLISQGLNIPCSVHYSDYEDFQYQTPLIFAAKKVNNNFNAESIKEFFTTNYSDFYEKLEITGKGFFSVKFHTNALKDTFIHHPQKVVVDYCGVNVAKQMHIGHIRSMFIGDYIVRLHKNAGDYVQIFNHIGDWGNQFGFLIAYIQKNNLQNSLNNKTLTQYYKEAYSLYQNDESFAQEAQTVAGQLQNKTNAEVLALWQQMVDVSMSEAQKTFDELGLLINLSHTQGESFYAPFCNNILEDLLNKNIAKKESDGSVAVFFEDKSPLILQKSNGNYLYALYDLAAIDWRVKNINPDKMIYVVDKRQSLHFEQVFEVAKKAGFAPTTLDLIHLGFGTILGADKKPLKTKSGQSLYLDELFEQGKSILLSDEYYQHVKAEFKTEILQKTIVGGMKFYDLKFNKHQDYVFDWSHVLNFSGNSAPYLQNALVRIDSIFCKKFGPEYILSDIIKINTENFIYDSDEKNILFNCFKTKELLHSNLTDYASQQLTTHSIKMCQLFHKYYEKEKILGHEDEDKKLQLIAHVFSTIENLIDVLGISWYDCEQKLEYKKKQKFKPKGIK